ncbi:6-phosphogluconate dehydrogenase NAD-binding [Beutenbergia cavernae DSM 12333]|uniref:6-phosphogluconate dehydrogenase NAD-binding n=1 Tax=Beutenbergia cavernae (strain ATCC BAA-8 / DSM 12333 / CCUG 43141 / JCM 11478 / NBRC 16432 / NCIMB 13614 / HKI 0122) TaxID=471853 RepID=C5C5Y9_BEUC1|nr:NAD(P)-binding domain-containing protein [Beutenbergia cavernae]ACQ82347.1 6-phosphogluconate dehydrogenase NAD-binding [Beutenbergia cavernae DSM 12333]
MSGAAKAPVTLVGLGPMGQAMVRVLLAAGHPVTVWNRTPSRADDLVAEGAVLAATPADAVGASELVILSLTDYGAMHDILDPAAGALRGRTIVNLSSDTPDVSRAASAWADEHGATFLTGGAMVPPPMIGTPAAYVYYSGPTATFRTWEAVLAVIGAPRYLGEDPGLAQLLYQAQLDVFLTALSGLAHATALTAAAGVPAAEFLPDAMRTLTEIPAMATPAELARSFDTGVHPGDLATATMMGATAAHILAASESAGIDLELPRAVASHYERAIAAGHGRDSWTSILEVIRAR